MVFNQWVKMFQTELTNHGMGNIGIGLMRIWVLKLRERGSLIEGDAKKGDCCQLDDMMLKFTVNV